MAQIQVAVKNKPAHGAVIERMQDFDLFAGGRCTQKIDCGSLSRLHDPYELRYTWYFSFYNLHSPQLIRVL